MKGKCLRKLGSLVFSLLLLPGVVALFSSTTAEAQRFGYNPYFDYYSRYGHYIFNNSEAAFNQGYEDGLKTGRNDAKDDKTYNPERSHYYQEAGFGNFGEPFRSGFLKGYADGYRT